MDNLKLNNITIDEIESVINYYLKNKHPSHSNWFIIRLGDNITQIHERRRSYIIKFPLINTKEDINQIINTWSDYALNNIIENYNITQQMTICSIDPIKFSSVSDIIIRYSGEVINPELIIKKLTFDIIEQLNKHIIELYIDEHYPHIDIDDDTQRTNFNKIFDNIKLEEIYKIYPFVEIYVPLNINSDLDSSSKDIIFYLNATINTTDHIINIIDDIRECLDSNDTNEIITYDKEEIVYKFGSNKQLASFNIITDPII